MTNYLKTFRKAVRQSPACDISEISDQRGVGEVLKYSPLLSHKTLLSRVAYSEKTFADSFAALERRCPDYVEPARWHQGVEDGRRFLATWGTQAGALGWTVEELFGLHDPPSNPHPTYRRLARYDCTGLIWLLTGKTVVAMTETTATIRHNTGAITIYRKENKPGLGPLGDSLDDFIP